MKLLFVLVLLVGTTLAGCVDTEDTPPAPEPKLEAVDASAGLMDCVQVAAGFQVEIERVQSRLPAGFTAVEGRPFGGLTPNLPTGTVTVTVGAISCGSAELEAGPLDQFVITADVEAPRTDAVESRTTHHAYRLQTYTAGVRHGAFFEAANASVVAADVDVDAQVTSMTSEGTAVISDSEGIVFELEALAGGRVPLGVSARFWEVLPEGLLVLDWEQNTEPLVAYDLGSVRSCAVREGTLLHELLGTTDCTNMQTVGMVIPVWHADGRLRVIPEGGVEATG